MHAWLRCRDRGRAGKAMPSTGWMRPYPRLADMPMPEIGPSVPRPFAHATRAGGNLVRARADSTGYEVTRQARRGELRPQAR